MEIVHMCVSKEKEKRGQLSIYSLVITLGLNAYINHQWNLEFAGTADIPRD